MFYNHEGRVVVEEEAMADQVGTEVKCPKCNHYRFLVYRIGWERDFTVN